MGDRSLFDIAAGSGEEGSLDRFHTSSGLLLAAEVLGDPGVAYLGPITFDGTGVAQP